MTREALWGVLGAAFGLACGGESPPPANVNANANVPEPASASASPTANATPAPTAAAPTPSAPPSATVAATEVAPRPAPTALATPDEDRIPVGWYLPPGAPIPPHQPPKPAPPAPPPTGRGTLADIKVGSAVCGATSCGQKTSNEVVPKFRVQIAMPARQDLPGDGTTRAERTVAGLTTRIKACMTRAWNQNPTIGEHEQKLVLEVHADGGKKIGYVRPKQALSEASLERCIEAGVASRFGGDDAPAVAEMTIRVTKE